MPSPFKFLDPYERGDRRIFFGRDDEIIELFNLVRRSNLVVVYGKSGTGKTSLIKCGLMSEFEDSEALMLEVRRRGDINRSLRETLLTVLKRDVKEAVDITTLINSVYNRCLRPIYLFFDQLEEIFILGNIEEKSDFINTLEIIRSTEIPCVIVLVIREEYLAELTDFRKISPYIFDFTLQVGRMDQAKSTIVAEKILKSIKYPSAKQDLDYLGANIRNTYAVAQKIIEIVSNGEFFIDLPYLQVYLDSMFKAAIDKSDKLLVIDEELLDDPRLASIETVVKNLLDEQIKKVCLKIGENSDAKTLSFLKIFISDRDTKIPVSYLKIFEIARNYGLTNEQIEICLDVFSNALLIRPLDGNQYELSHDSLAAEIAMKRSTVRRVNAIIKGNPYKGLAAFTESEEDIKRFFGRGEAVAKVLKLLTTNTLVVVSGASGTGKSSLVKAGIFPELKRKGYQFFEILRPGDYPLTPLRSAITAMSQHIEDSAGLVLLIDQYEELITRAKNDSDVREFTNLLVKLIETPDNLISNFNDQTTVKIIVTVRADFEPQFKDGELKRYWDSGRYVVPYMSTRELEQIIESPAELAACYFEPPTLIKNIAEEVVGRPSALPLLSFALSQMYEASLPNLIVDTQIYNSVGVFGALQTKANSIYYGFDDETRSTMRSVMLRMVSLEGTEVASRRVLTEELRNNSLDENRRVDDVIDVLASERLIVKIVNGNNQVFIEPAHDALLKGWNKLWEWLKDFGKENILLRERLNSAISEWKEHDQVAELLWADDRHYYEISNLQSEEWLNKDERTYVEKSVLRYRQIKDEKGFEELRNSQLIVEKDIFQRKAEFQRNVAIGSFVVLVIMGYFGWIVDTKRISAENDKKQAMRSEDSALVLRSQERIERLRIDPLYRSEVTLNKIIQDQNSRALLQLNSTIRQVDSFKKTKDSLINQQNQLVLHIKRLAYIRDSTTFQLEKAIRDESIARKNSNELSEQNSLIKKTNASLAQKNDTLNIQLKTQTDSIAFLNILTPYRESSQIQSFGAIYREEIAKRTDYRTQWPPSSRLNVGDVGKFLYGQFVVYSTLKVLDIPVKTNVYKPKKENYNFASGQVEIQSDTAGAYNILLPQKSFLIQMNDASLIKITNLSEISQNINALFKESRWDKDWLIITEIVTSNNGFIAANTSNRKGELTISNLTTNGNASAPIKVVQKSSGVDLTITGLLTPFFKVYGLRDSN